MESNMTQQPLTMVEAQPASFIEYHGTFLYKNGASYLMSSAIKPTSGLSDFCQIF
jgi:hypothetical protein